MPLRQLNLPKPLDLLLLTIVVPLLALSYFLFFILGDTYLRWYLLPAYILGLFLIFIRFHAFFPKKNILIPIWILFLVWSGISGIFSHALSLSLDFFLFQLALFTTFVTIVTFRTFLHTQKKEILILGETFEHIFVLFFILIGVVLSILSFGFLVNPDWALKLPGFNLLHASYGHNHLASYLILILPVSWWITLKNRSVLLFLCTVFMTLSLVTSFGRVAVAIGFIQLLFLTWLYFKSSISSSLELSKSIRRKLKITFSVFVALFLAAILAKTYFSLISVVFPTIPEFLACPIPEIAKKMCKPIDSEARVYYWQQGLSAIQAFPLFGYGPGTFSLVSSKYALISSQWSGYAHNAYLQMTAELGLIGGALFLFKKFILVGLVFSARKNKKEQLFITSILIGLISLFINNLFDFDWNFIGVATTAIGMVALAVTVPSFENKTTGATDPVMDRFQIQKIIVVSFFILVFTSASVVLYTEYLFTQNKFKEVLRFFPHVSHHSVGLVEYDDWSNEELDRLVEVYKYQSIPLESLLIGNFSYPNWLQAYGHVHAARRGISVTSMMLPNWANQHLSLYDRVAQYEALLNEAHELSKLHESYLWFPTKEQVLKNYMSMANQMYTDGELQRSGQMYAQMVSHDQWILSDISFAFLQKVPPVSEQNRNAEAYLNSVISQVEPTPDLLLFLREVVAPVGKQLGYNSNVFGEVYLSVLQSNLETELATCSTQLQSCTLLNSDALITDIQNILTISPWNVGRVWDLVSMAYSTPFNQNTSSTSLQQADTMLSKWFEAWQVLNEFNTTEWQIGYPHTADFVYIAQKILLQFSQDEIQLSEYVFDSSISQETSTHFESLLTKMTLMRPDDYIIQSQLGNFYIMISEDQKAEQAYQNCLIEYERTTQNIQYDCQSGLENLSRQDIWRGRFIQIGEEIMIAKVTSQTEKE